MPTQQYTPADIPLPRESHTLVHQVNCHLLQKKCKSKHMNNIKNEQGEADYSEEVASNHHSQNAVPMLEAARQHLLTTSPRANFIKNIHLLNSVALKSSLSY
jgi:hypothetical protein